MTVGAVVVLEAGRDDLGGRGRVLVDQDHHREVVEGAVLLRLEVLLGVFRPLVLTITPSSRNRSETSTARAEQPAGIVAEVEDQRLHPLGLQLAEGLLQLVGRVLDEAGDPDVADLLVLVEHEVPLIVGLAVIAQDAGDVDDGAGDRDRLGLLVALMQDAAA